MGNLQTYGRRTDRVIGAVPVTERAILIKVKNAAALARSQGSMATLAQSIAPATIEAKVYSTMADKLSDALKDQGVDASVELVDPAAWKPSGSGHIWQDVGIALGTFGVVAIVWRMFAHRGGKK